MSSRASDRATLSEASASVDVVTTTSFAGPLQTPVGEISETAGPAGIRSVGWCARGAVRAGSDAEPAARAAMYQLAEYFAGRRRDFDLPLDLGGLSPATRAVLGALQTIPYGSTVTYAELAGRSGTTLPPRAIGSVMASNPVPLLIPCHRVVASDGLGGFSGGVPGQERRTKLWLLELEGALPPALL